MTRIRRVLACTSALAIAILFSSSVAPAGAADPASNAAASSAVAWLRTQQLPDGSFEVAQFGGFETRDAVLAIAEQAQTGTSWNRAEALAAVQALEAGGSGPTPLDYLQALMAAPTTDAGSAAKTVVLVTAPLGIDATAFGSVNLLNKIGGCDGTSSATFNGLLYLVVAQQLLCGGAPSASVTAVRDAQQANGGWGFTGDNTAADVDNDTTAVAVEALIGGGATITDPAVRSAMAFFAANFQSDGAWQSFGADDPNSTALAVLGVTAAGFDVTTSCWRDRFAPDLAGTAYTSPDAWLRSQQVTTGVGAGRFASPSDTFGQNTFATSQSVEGLLRSWLPVARGAEQVCTTVGPTPSVSTTTPTAGGTMTISGDGFAPGASLTITLHSDPVVLATATADANGAYSVTVTIPAATTPGTHQIVVSGLGPDGQPRESVVTIEVQAAAQVLAAVATTTAGSVVSIQPAFTG